MYAADRSTFVGSLPLNAPPPCGAIAAVGVDDDLAAGEAGVGLRSADLEPPGRVHQHRARRRVELGELAQHRIDDLGLDVGLEERLDVDLLAVLRARSGPYRRGPACRPRTRSMTWLFPSGRRYGTTPALRTSARRSGEPVRHGDRQRHQLLGLAAGEAEHHALVAGAERDRARRAECPSRCSSASSTPRAMSGDCSWIAVMTPHVSPSSPNFASV